MAKISKILHILNLVPGIQKNDTSFASSTLLRTCVFVRNSESKSIARVIDYIYDSVLHH